MEESKNLAQKALFECTEDELKEKESQAWHWESKEELGNLDYNRIVIEEDIPGNIYDLRNKWVTFYEEEGNIGNNDASVKKTGADREDDEIVEMNTLINDKQNYNNCLNSFLTNDITMIEKSDDRVEIDMQGQENESDMSEKVAHVNTDIPRQYCQLKLCCKLTINEKMDKFIQQENSLPTLDLRCKECSKNICNECLMENSKMSLIQKKLFLKTWQSIQVVRKDGELRVEADIS